MTYFSSWLIIIASVLATLVIGFVLNRYALRRHHVAAPSPRPQPAPRRIG